MGGVLAGVVIGLVAAAVLVAFGAPWSLAAAAFFGWLCAGLLTGALCEAAGQADAEMERAANRED